MPEFAEHDQEDDGGGNPGIVFVHVDDFVAEDCNKPRCCCDDYDTRVARDVVVDSVDKLGADYDVD